MKRYGLIFLLAAATAFSQTANVTLNGTVTDKNGASLPAATVTATNTQTALARTATTDEQGRYTILSLPAGNYDIRVEHPQFQSVLRRNQVFEVGQTITLDFSLDVASVTQTIEVQAAAPIVETTQNILDRVVETKELDALPDLNRSFSDLAALSPGVQGSGSSVQIGNSQNYQTGYVLDGTNLQSNQSGGQAVAVAQDWIQEFNVLTAQFPAEYGTASGGVLNAITRSGTNEVHGRAYGFFQNSALNSNPWVLPPAVPTKLPFNQERIGAMAGGPIKKDKLFIFSGYEFLHNLTTRTVSIPAAFVGPGSSSGSFPNTLTTNLAMVKLDYQLSSTNSLAFRGNVETDNTANSGIGGIVTVGNGKNTFNRNTAYSANWTKLLSAATINELRLGTTFNNSYSACPYVSISGLPPGNPVGNWAQLAYPTATVGCSPNFGHNQNKQYTLYESWSHTTGPHQFKAGALINRGRLFQVVRNNEDGQFTFPSIGGTSVPFSPSNPATFPLTDLIQYSPVHVFSLPLWSYGVYAQDSWHVLPSLTLNLGVRYDLDFGQHAVNKYVPAGFHPIEVQYTEIQPRTGFAWSPFRDKNKTVIRGGFGIYYDQSHSNVAGVYMLNTYLPLLPGGGVFNVNATRPALNPYCTGNPACASGAVPAALQSALKEVLAYSLATLTLPNFPVNGGPITFGGATYTLPPLPLVPGTTIPAPTGGTNDLDKNFPTPGTRQVTVGMQRSITNSLDVSADYVGIWGFNQYILRNVNVDKNGNPINPLFQTINSFGTIGWFTSQGLRVHVGYRDHRGDTAQLAYTFSHANADGTLGIGSRGTVATDPYDLSVDNGPEANDIHHILVVSGNGNMHWGFVLAPLITYSSAPPYTATTTAAVVPGCLVYYSSCYPAGYGHDSLRGASTLTVNGRLLKTFKLGEKKSITGYFEAYNLINKTNFTSFQANVTAATFGQPTAAGAKRQLQYGARFDF